MTFHDLPPATFHDLSMAIIQVSKRTTVYVALNADGDFSLTS